MNKGVKGFSSAPLGEHLGPCQAVKCMYGVVIWALYHLCRVMSFKFLDSMRLYTKLVSLNRHDDSCLCGTYVVRYC